jgi:hypothetical protein
MIVIHYAKLYNTRGYEYHSRNMLCYTVEIEGHQRE